MKKASTHILRIGVTGGIGSGKSLVCSLFSRLGVPVLSADEIAKEVMNAHPEVRRKIVDLLGSAAYGVDGLLDRRYVASKLFNNKNLQTRLNAIVHPVVEAEIDRRTEALTRDGSGLVVIEAALVYEAGLDKRLDVVVVVDADEKERIRRVTERDHVSPSEVRKRIKAQWSASRKVRQADYVIRNNDSVQMVETNVQFLYNLFTLLAE